MDLDFGTRDGVCTLAHSNLGGAGPDSGAAELRYHAVGTVGGATIDLVVRATNEYKGASGSNGCNGLFGQVFTL